MYLVRFIADLRLLSFSEKEKIVTDENIRGTTAELLVSSRIRTRAPPNPFLAAVPSRGKEDAESLPGGDPLFAIPNSLFAGPGRGPLRIPMSKFTAPDFDLKEEKKRATDASFKWRAGEYFKLAGTCLLEAATRGGEGSLEGEGAVYQYTCPRRSFQSGSSGVRKELRDSCSRIIDG